MNWTLGQRGYPGLSRDTRGHHMNLQRQIWWPTDGKRASEKGAEIKGERRTGPGGMEDGQGWVQSERRKWFLPAANEPVESLSSRAATVPTS